MVYLFFIFISENLFSKEFLIFVTAGGNGRAGIPSDGCSVWHLGLMVPHSDQNVTRSIPRDVIEICND